MNAKFLLFKIKVISRILSRRDQIRLLMTLFMQLALSVLDLISIALLGLIASITLFGIQSRNLPDNIQELINYFSLDQLTFQSQVAILGLIAGVLLVGKTIFSAYIFRKVLYFLNLKTALITADLLELTLKKPYDFVKTRNPSEFLYSLTRGVNSLVTGVIGSIGIILTEVVLLTIITIGLLVFDPIITLFSTLFFGIFAVIQGRNFGVKAANMQGDSVKILIASEQRILESLYMYRELHVRNARVISMKKLIDSRTKMAKLNASVEFLPYFSKYSMEIMLVIGSIFLMASQFLLKDAISALSTLAVFVVASTRVSPSILRLQQALVKFRASLSESEFTVRLIDEITSSTKSDEKELEQNSADPIRTTEVCSIEVLNVSFKYRESKVNAISGVSLRIQDGEMFALIGRSGNGKSTLMDLMMGALAPTSGSVLIKGLNPNEFIRLNPGMIGYAAQESVFSNGSIRENILLGIHDSQYDDEEIWKVLDKVGLKELIGSLPRGLDSNLGERGLSFSVGQRQRLSIARAIFTNPKILFLDEPTSALDSESEKLISELIEDLKGKVTIIVIAHRLNTIKSADRIAVISEGAIQQIGEFNEVSSELNLID